MNFNPIKNSICGLVIAGLLVGLSVPKTSLFLDVLLTGSLMGVFIFMLLSDR